MSKKINETGINSNPYKIIEDFFSADDLSHYRKYISSMLKAAYSEDYWKKSDPGSLLFFQEQMENLIKAAHLISDNSDNDIGIKKEAVLEYFEFNMELDPLTYFRRHGGCSIWEFFPRSLSRKEFANPYLTFEKFFKFNDCGTWLKDFKELISYALSPYGNDSGIDFDYLGIYRHLQKLIEASHLIFVRALEPKLLESLNDNLSEKSSGDNSRKLKT